MSQAQSKQSKHSSSIQYLGGFWLFQQNYSNSCLHRKRVPKIVHDQDALICDLNKDQCNIQLLHMMFSFQEVMHITGCFNHVLSSPEAAPTYCHAISFGVLWGWLCLQGVSSKHFATSLTFRQFTKFCPPFLLLRHIFTNRY